MNSATKLLLPVVQDMVASLRKLRDMAFAMGAHEKPHSFVLPDATYAPWLSDKAFRACWRAIRDHTLVDVYRCHELYRLALQVAPLGGDFLEVGVWRGGTGCLLAHALKAAGSGQTIHLADTFAGVVKAGERDTHYKGGEHADTSEEVVSALLQGLGLTNARLLKGVFPDETGMRLADTSLSLCHIDVDTHDSARDVFAFAWPRLLAGGVIVFDDYGFHGCEGVTRFVDELDLGRSALLIHNLNGHAVLIKR